MTTRGKPRRRSLRDVPPDALRVPTGDWFINRVGLICRVTAHPGRREALVARLMAAAELAGETPGCYLYLINPSATDPDDVWVVAAWRNRAQHEAWLARPEIQDLLELAGELFADTAEPIFTVPVGGKGLAIRRTSS